MSEAFQDTSCWARERKDPALSAHEDPVFRRALLLSHVEAGDDLMDYLDVETGRWHDHYRGSLSLREYLGLNEIEFGAFVREPGSLLAMIRGASHG